MSKTRDNSPELDYFELRRRHEEYKRARSAPQVEKPSMEERLERQVSQRKAKPEPVVAEETPVINDVEDELQVEAQAAPMDAFEEAIEENYEAYEDDVDYDEEADEEAANPNPFDSFIRFFSGVKSNLSSRRNKGDELEDLDLEDLTDEELAELEAEDFEDLDEEFEGLDEEFEEEEAEPAPAKPRFSLRRNAKPDVDEDEEEDEIASVEDIADIDDSPRPVAAAGQVEEIEDDFEDEDFDEEDFDDSDFEGLDDEDFDDEDLEDEDEEDLPRKSGFKKFVNLFVTRVDEDEEIEEEEYEELDDEELEDVDFDDDDEIEEIEEVEEEEEPVRKGFFSRVRKNKSRRFEEDEAIYDDLAPEIQTSPEGGQSKMDELNKLAPETPAAAEVIETSGMSRRERRELAMRLAAEEAARKAEEEARAQAEAAPVEQLSIDSEEKEAPVDMAAFEAVPETDLIVETTAEEVIETVDEPTREFTPVSMRDVQAAAEKAIFDVDEDDEDDEDEDDEEEIVEKKPRRGLFGRRRAKVEEEDEDDDLDDEDEDEDEDDFDDEDEDEEEEIVEKKPRRGLFGRKRAKVEEEDEDEEDDEDDFDDEDEDEDELDNEYDDEDEDDDDEYDEYDDDEDEDEYDDDDDEYDDYDDDDDEPRRSFGHHLIGIFKFILGVILVLLVVVIGFNFHYFVTGENAIVTKVHEMLGDSAASDVLCFGYVMREAMPAEEAAAPEAALEAEITAEPTVLPQAEAEIPDLGSNGAITEAPVVEAAPVIEAAPAVEEAPVVQAAPVTSGSVG